MSEPLDEWCNECGFGDHKTAECPFRKSELASARMLLNRFTLCLLGALVVAFYAAAFWFVFLSPFHFA
jgi:hypothetical protein